MTETRSDNRSTDAASLIANVLRTLKTTVAVPADAEMSRLFFPEGIDHISITVKAGGVEVALLVAGPKSKPTLLDHATERTQFDIDGVAMALPDITGFVQLPRGTADYRVYEPAERQFGTQRTIDTIGQVARQVHGADPGLIFSVGDISFADGSPMPPHQAHRSGRNVDHRPIRRDRVDRPVTFTSADYDRDATAKVIAAYLAHANVHSILFNDTSIPGVTSSPGHDNHFHVQTLA